MPGGVDFLPSTVWMLWDFWDEPHMFQPFAILVENKIFP